MLDSVLNSSKKAPPPTTCVHPVDGPKMLAFRGYLAA